LPICAMAGVHMSANDVGARPVPRGSLSHPYVAQKRWFRFVIVPSCKDAWSHKAIAEL
jgi:hypothetical protein